MGSRDKGKREVKKPKKDTKKSSPLISQPSPPAVGVVEKKKKEKGVPSQ